MQLDSLLLGTDGLLLECTINIVLSNDVNATDAQSAPFVIFDMPGKKKRSCSPFASVETMSKVEDDSATQKVGNGLIQQFQVATFHINVTTTSVGESDLS